MLNTSVAILPDTGMIMVCAAARLPPIVVRHYVGLTLGSAFVLTCETGFVRTNGDSDH